MHSSACYVEWADRYILNWGVMQHQDDPADTSAVSRVPVRVGTHLWPSHVLVPGHLSMYVPMHSQAMEQMPIAP